MPTLRSMRRAPGPLLIDGITALAVFALIAQQLITRHVLLPGQRPTTVLTWLLPVVIVAPILTHRRFPRASVAVCLAAVALYAAGHYVAYPGYAIFVLTFDIALHSDEQVSVPTLFASAVVLGVAVDLQPAKVAVLATYLLSEICVGAAWLVGWNLRRRRARWAELQARTERLERERQEEARRAVAEERLRIARELHDVIAHSMSVIAVQSAVGNHVIDTQPAEARQALAAIEATSRSALTEMRRLLGVLRREGEPRGSLTPAPGLVDLASLVAQVQDAGLRVWINVEGQRGSVPPGVDLSAYRVIQEALTNVIKHAGSSSATVTIRYGDDSVAVEITNQGPAAPHLHVPRPRIGSGHGIIGMRERVAVFGGEFAAGPRPDGGFLVRACFPIAAGPG
jgi:signal transduction histidine kinase